MPIPPFATPKQFCVASAADKIKRLFQTGRANALKYLRFAIGPDFCLYPFRAINAEFMNAFALFRQVVRIESNCRYNVVAAVAKMTQYQAVKNLQNQT